MFKNIVADINRLMKKSSHPDFGKAPKIKQMETKPVTNEPKTAKQKATEKR
jgi:hypothetical protein